jgi:hypothetical protein
MHLFIDESNCPQASACGFMALLRKFIQNLNLKRAVGILLTGGAKTSILKSNQIERGLQYGNL